MEGPTNHYGKLHPQEERYHFTSSWCSIIHQGAVQCQVRDTQEIRRPTTHHFCDARQGQQARETRYDGKENMENMIDLKSNLYTYFQKHIADQLNPTVQEEQKEEEEEIENSSREEKKKEGGEPREDHPEDKKRKRDEKYDEKHSQK